MILDDLVAATKRRLTKEKQTESLEQVKARAATVPTKDPQQSTTAS